MESKNPIKVQIKNVYKEYEGRNGKIVALNGMTLDIRENEFITIVGPSGCGKSTILNIVAGLLEPTSGEVSCNGKLVVDTGSERGVVFQQYALFPWLTVRKNIEFGLKLARREDMTKPRMTVEEWRKNEEPGIRKSLKREGVKPADINQRVDRYFRQGTPPYHTRKYTENEIKELTVKYIKGSAENFV